MDRIVNPDPDVQQAKAGDNAASHSIERKRREMGNEKQKVVIAPEVRPGKNNQNKPEIKPDHDPHGKLQVLQPARSSRTSRRATVREWLRCRI
jgi:hypothetical protein